MESQYILFNTSIGAKKPENIKNKKEPCPFCAPNQLAEIIDEDGPIILVKNKYPVLENTFQTVLIETDECNGEFSTYNRAHLHRLMKFGLKHWLEMEETGLYESVIFMKNRGPLSGGSISHPHMQIIGLKKIDYREKLMEKFFYGLQIKEQNGVRFNLSTEPMVGFYEFNIEMPDSGYVDEFGEYVQIAARYILEDFPYKTTSYNVFFYHFNQRIYAKVVPRFITTPLIIGYGIPQKANNFEWMAEQVQELYFEVKQGSSIISN